VKSLRGIASLLLVVLLLGTLLTPDLKVAAVWTGKTIYIRSDGSVDPSDAPIKRMGNTYYVTEDIIIENTSGIAIEKDNIVLDGNNHSITGSGSGIILEKRRNVTIRNMVIRGFEVGINLVDSRYNVISSNSIDGNVVPATGHRVHIGIFLYSSVNNIISYNDVMNNDFGIYVTTSKYNIISGNNINGNYEGIQLDSSSYNVISGNSIEHNYKGIDIEMSSGNVIFHNNFVNNTRQVYSNSSVNTWDNGYPSGGNYWSDYKGIDEKSGPNQDQPGSDGIGDTPYSIKEGVVDRYPLMKPWGTKIFSITIPPDLILIEPQISGLTVTVNGVATPGYAGASITKIHWDWGDGSSEDSPFPASHTYSNAGMYTVTVTAYQSDGLSVTKTLQIKVISPYLLWKYKTGGSVYGVSVSCDGSYIAATSFDGYVYFFNRSGNLLWKYKREFRWNEGVSVSCDGNYIAAGSGGAVYFFNRSGNLLWKYWTETGGKSVDSVSVSSDGSYIAAGSLFDGYVYFFGRSGDLLWKHKIGRVRSVSVSSDGSYIAAGSDDRHVYFFNRSGNLLWKHETGCIVDSILISPDGSYIAAEWCDTLYFFNRSGNLLRRWKTGSIVSFSISSDGSYIAAGSWDNNTYLFDKSGDLLWKYETGGRVWSVSISSDGNYIAAGSDDGYVYFFTMSPPSPPKQQIPSPPQQTPEQKIPATKTPLADILYLLPIPLLAILLVFVLIRSKEKGKRR
jgi:parallel beta-helix repeat protein